MFPSWLEPVRRIISRNYQLASPPIKSMDYNCAHQLEYTALKATRICVERRALLGPE